MKRLFAAMLALCMVLCLGAASAEAYTAGTYTASSQGMKPMTLEVTFSDSAITEVKITEHGETYGIGFGLDAAPVEAIPAWIVENQSLAADLITGATISSRAIINGVADAVAQAGGDAEALKAKAVETVIENKTLECDVVVAGAGAAGLGAAVAAVENGASVILLEKQGVTGGPLPAPAATSSRPAPPCRRSWASRTAPRRSSTSTRRSAAIRSTTRRSWTSA